MTNICVLCKLRLQDHAPSDRVRPSSKAPRDCCEGNCTVRTVLPRIIPRLVPLHALVRRLRGSA